MKFTICLFLFLFIPIHTMASTLTDMQIYEKRMELYKKYEKKSGIPWYELAAVDQYERNIRSVRSDIPDKQEGVIGIYIPKESWFGPLYNELLTEKSFIIQMFGGYGRDGDGDGIANQNNDEDILATFIYQYGIFNVDKNKYEIDYSSLYTREESRRIVKNYTRIYKKYNRLNLSKHVFPVPINSNHSIKASFGALRGYGGRRIHEGVDIFAPHGLPVRSITYGIVETKGWNNFGGWRIGIRDLYNNYHYYAHLGGFMKGVNEGDIVEPGTILGYVGNSGYGNPGTVGKFPPHLHYGIYKDNGKTEWSFDPYYFLIRWKQEEKAN
ncbi:MAG: M23 family metallopeptidase [Bacillaceae bacterium]